MIIQRYEYIQIHVEDGETEAVRIAVTNLKRDLRRVLDCNIDMPAHVPSRQIYVGTLGVSRQIEERIDRSLLQNDAGRLHKEAYLIQVDRGDLVIAGTDRRGTIYGVYEFCRKWLGVSPWHFFADVPVRGKDRVELAEGYCEVDHPVVEYRGIFINDEEELEHWVQRYMGEDTIGIKTYEKIFELLLRLRLNYIWCHARKFI